MPKIYFSGPSVLGPVKLQTKFFKEKYKVLSMWVVTHGNRQIIPWVSPAAVANPPNNNGRGLSIENAVDSGPKCEPKEKK